MGNKLLRLLAAMIASVLVGACSLFGAQKPAEPVAAPVPQKDPWQAIKTELSDSNTSGGGIVTSAMDDGSLKTVLPGDASFDKGSSAIKVSAQPGLYQISQSLNRHPAVHVKLVGYSDNSGDSDFNVALSKNRARSVSEYLVAHGIDQARINVEGRGDANPIDDNSSPAGRARNRRVEIYLMQ